ncbi:NAD(P)H-binding protein [Agilicoccus flavus]|uniref:NAD(P)H-binding protein n=1 Tax=Agilicoccus flavus TaxID=2775968 RepID=UPI001CF69E72|nr:NAD(P)H-binding protein [Agilicoccus flavus]
MSSTVLLTGVTGYIGAQLVEPLLKRGYTVRALTRSAGKLADAPWADRVEVVEGDATKDADLDRALDGVDVAYYLLHSMDGEGDFRARDRRLAQQFTDAAARAGVGRIVYLGGLHPRDEELSEHLASRKEVGEVFLAGPVPAACLQAAVILGDGSASFDMLRYLTERLPAMVAPRWLRNRIQPIAVDDAVFYLVGAAELPPEVDRTFDIGGPEVLTYADMMQRFAKVTGRRPRIVVTLPVLTPGLASHWVGFVTPVSAGVAKPLVGSLIHEVVRSETDLDGYTGLPEGGLTGFDDAVRAAMRHAEPSPGPGGVAVGGVVLGAAAAAGAVAGVLDAVRSRRKS